MIIPTLVVSRFALTFYFQVGREPLPPFSLSPSHVLATLSQPIAAHRKNVTVLRKPLRIPRILLDLFTESESFVWRERQKPRVHIFCSSRVLLQGTRCLGRNDGEGNRSSFFRARWKRRGWLVDSIGTIYYGEIKCFRRIRHNKRSLEIFVSASDQIDIGYELLSSHARVENWRPFKKKENIGETIILQYNFHNNNNYYYFNFMAHFRRNSFKLLNLNGWKHFTF